MTIYPIEYLWDGSVMKPQPRFMALARKQFTVGEMYMLGVQRDRSGASHRHYFACVNEAWRNLPEDKIERYPSPSHLRRWALIKSGYFSERTIACESTEQAHAIVAMVEALDEYSITVVKGDVVKIYTAKSQSIEAMTKSEFERSKADVLALLSEVIGVSIKQLEQQGRQSDVSE